MIGTNNAYDGTRVTNTVIIGTDVLATTTTIRNTIAVCGDGQSLANAMLESVGNVFLTPYGGASNAAATLNNCVLIGSGIGGTALDIPTSAVVTELSETLNIHDVIYAKRGQTSREVRIGGAYNDDFNESASLDIRDTNGALYLPRISDTTENGLPLLAGFGQAGVWYNTAKNKLRTYSASSPTQRDYLDVSAYAAIAVINPFTAPNVFAQNNTVVNTAVAITIPQASLLTKFVSAGQFSVDTSLNFLDVTNVDVIPVTVSVEIICTFTAPTSQNIGITFFLDNAVQVNEGRTTKAEGVSDFIQVSLKTIVTLASGMVLRPAIYNTQSNNIASVVWCDVKVERIN